MKRGSAYYSNLSLLAGLAITLFVFHASLNHRLTWTKLVLFWIGVTGIAFFLLFRVFGRVQTFRHGRPVFRYRRRYRAFCALVLLGLTTFTAGFSYYAAMKWREPPIYWELAEQIRPSPNRFVGHWLLGNQRHDRSVELTAIQLVELADLSLNEQDTDLAIVCTLDSVRLLAGNDPEQRARAFTSSTPVDLGPLAARSIRLDFEYRQRFAIFEVAASYRSGQIWDMGSNAGTVATGKYIVIESPHAEVTDFEHVANLASRPSTEIREAVILALGRTHHPKALPELLKILELPDPRVQNAVCQALAELKDERAVPALINVANKNQSAQALRALANIGSNEAIAFLISVLSDAQRESFMRATAADALGKAGVEEAEPALLPVARDVQDFFIQREALWALARINATRASEVILDISRKPLPNSIVKNVLEVVVKLNQPEFLPLLTRWISDWRANNLALSDLQLVLDDVVKQRQVAMIRVLVESLQKEHNTEAQLKLVSALSSLAGKDFGPIQYPVLNFQIDMANRKVIASWNHWWGKANREGSYLKQDMPQNSMN